MASGKQLEKNLKNIMRQFFTLKYWPSRSGVQDGFDAYAKFNIDDKDYIWKYECKDHNAQKHKQNFDYLKEIEISDFSDKIMQIMARGEPYPHVFCLFFPHKIIGNNTRLRDSIDSWNLYNKFPFKIRIWDFDFLKDIIPSIDSADADLIYPNAPVKDKSKHEGVIKELSKEIKKESIDGYFHNRSYIKERQSKSSLLLDNVLHIKINIPIVEKGQAQEIEFHYQDRIFRCLYSEILDITMDHYPVQKNVKKSTSIKILRKDSKLTPIRLNIKTTENLFDEKEYMRLLNENKNRLLNLFKGMKDNIGNLFNLIHNFCETYNQGVISFVVPRNIKLASIPIKELNAKDFNSKNNTHFYFEFKDN